MRWKTLFYDSDITSDSQKIQSKNTKNYLAPKSKKCPPQVQSMNGSGKGLTKMIESIQFREVSSAFLLKLDKGIKSIRSSKEMFISADKKQNFYEIKIEDQWNILYENMTKTYKKADTLLPKKINIEAKKIAKQFNLDHKLNIMVKQKCFDTIKSHQPDFSTNPKYRLLNPTKSKLGKHVLQTVGTKLANKIKVNQCQNSNKVIKWFKNIPNKNECTFTVFDIQKFYPSMREDL